ncbi:MAG: large repetitive protein, partial [Pseudonocardiales bacterium]|nr:large repetitive protein [Pseudonocardiales bacterium]
LAAAGMSGTISGTVALTVPGVNASATMQLTIDTATSRFTIAATGLALEIAGQQLRGNFTFEQAGIGTARVVKVAATNVSLFLGDTKGAGPTDDVGLRLTGGTGALLLTSAGMAADVSGTVALVGLTGIPFSLGSGLVVGLQINTMPTAATQTFVVGGGTVVLALPAGRFLRVSITGDLTLFGQTLSGTFMFEQVSSAGADGTVGTTDDAKVLRIAATNVALFVGDDGGTPGTSAADLADDVGMRLSGGTALLVLTPEGFGGSIMATASVRLGGAVKATASVRVDISNMRRIVGGKVVAIAVNEEFVVGGETLALALPAGPYLKVTVTALSLTIAGQVLTADISYEKATALGADGALGTADDVTTQKIRFANVGLRLGTPDRDIVIVRNGLGTFDIVGRTGTTAGGIVGRIEATVELLIPGITFSGTLEVQINTLAAARAVDGVSIAPGIAVAGLDITLEVMGQRLSGDFAFAKNSATGDITLALSDVVLQLGDGTQTYVTATIASGIIVVTRGGIAGALVADIALNPAVLPGVTLSADVIVQINNTAGDLSSEILVGGMLTPFALAKNTLVVQVGLMGKVAEIGILGQTLTGVAFFEQRKTAAGAKVVRLAFTEVGMFLGDANGAGTADDVGLRLSGGRGAFIITQNGVAGEVSGAVQLVGLPIIIDAELTLQLNTMLVGGQGVVVNEVFQFAGVSVTTTTDGNASTPEVQKVIVAQPGGTFTLAIDANNNGTLEAGEISAPIAFNADVAVVDTAIESLLDSDAATNRVSVAATAGGYLVTWNANGNQAALQPNVRVLALPKGPFLRVEAANVDVKVVDITIHVDTISFERSGPAGAQITRIGFTGASLASTQDIGSSNPGLTGASGALIVFPPNAVTDPTTATPTRTVTGGVAGMLIGKVSSGNALFSANASVGFAINTTGAAVNTAVGGVVLDLTDDSFQFIVQNLDFNFGDVLEIRGGQFAISGNEFKGSGLELFIGSGPSMINGALNPAAVGVLIRNATVHFKKGATAADGWALRATGTIAFLGLDGLGISGTVSFQVNSSDTMSFTLDDMGGMTGAIGAGLFSFSALDVVIQAGDVVTLGGSLRLARSPSGVLDVSL